MPDAARIFLPCGAWCFIFGMFTAGGSLPRCHLSEEHEGDHLLTVESHVEPKAKFTITWTRIDGDDRG